MNKKFNQILSIIVLLSIIVTSCPIIAFAADTSGTYGIFKYEVTEGELTITGTTLTKTEIKEKTGTITIPASIDGYPTRYIGKMAFNGFVNVGKFIIPDGVKTIGGGAFYNCNSLQTLYLPDSITQIDDIAFGQCKNLYRLHLPANLEDLESGAFANSYKLKEVIIPRTLTKSTMDYGVVGIGMGQRCGPFINSGLEKITIEQGATVISKGLFMDCSSLESINIPNSVTKISEAAFSNCDKLETISGMEGIKDIEDLAFSWCSSLRSVPDMHNLTHLGSGAFYATGNLDKFYIPATLSSCDLSYGIVGIGSGNKCGPFTLSAISEIDFDNNLKKIPTALFYGCDRINKVNIPDSVTEIDSMAFMDCTFLEIITGMNNVNKINSLAFYNCSSLSSVYLSDNLTYIGGGAFGKTGMLKELVLPASITSVGTGYNIVGLGSGTIYPFQNSGLENVSIASGLKTLPSYVFCNCHNLKIVGIPLSVNKINMAAFGNCESITDVYYESTEEQWNSISIGESNSGIKNAVIHFFDDSYYPDKYNFYVDRWGFKNLTEEIDESYYKDLYGDIIGGLIYDVKEKGKHGHCYGMAITTAAILSNNPSVSSFAAFDGSKYNNMMDISPYSTITALGLSAKDYIKYGHIFQYSLGAYFEDEKNKNDLDGLIQAVRNYVENDGLPVVINIFGHTVFAIGIDGTDILINDSNTPIQINRIKINGKNWSYDAGYRIWNNNNSYISFSTKSDDFYSKFNKKLFVDDNTTLVKCENDDFDFVKNNSIVKIEDFNSNTENEIEKTALYWLHGNNLETTNLSKGTSCITLASNSSMISSNIPSNAKVNMTVSDLGNKISITTKPKDCFDAEFYFTGSNNLVSYCISAKTEYNNAYIKQTKNGFEVDGVNNICISFIDSNGSIINQSFELNGEKSFVVIDMDNNIYLTKQILSIELNDISVIYKSTVLLSPTITDGGGSYSVEYGSSDNNIAIVDDNGNVYGGKRGSATITCTVTDEYGNSVSDTCTVNVKYAWWQWIIEIVLFGWLWY